MLIVEDDDDIAESLASLLGSESFEVAVAGDGLAAVEKARTRGPDVILLDLMVPGLDGVSVAAALRQGRDALARVPLILVSAGRHLEEAAFEVGTPYFLRKPFDIDELLDLIRLALAHPPSEAASLP